MQKSKPREEKKKKTPEARKPPALRPEKKVGQVFFRS